MSKKLSSLKDLSKIQFDNLTSDKDMPPSDQPIFISQNLEAHFSNKGRAGKTVTIIKGFEGDKEELKILAKKLKSDLSVGGTIKNGEIIVQGNYRNELMVILREMGHKVKRIGG